MKIQVAKGAGFCFGVKRAIDITFDLAERTKEGVFSYGPLIHNPQVVEELEHRGVRSTDNVHSPQIRTLIIRTHGVSPEVYSEAKKMGYKVIDATCPFVRKAQNYTDKLKKEGYQVVIIGDRDHPEVRGLIGFAGEDVVVAASEDDLVGLKRKVGVIAQTTQRFEVFRSIVARIVDLAKEVKIFNTICDSTAQRVKETRELAAVVDLTIVVGGKNSANTNQLVALSRQLCGKVYHIETADEIEKMWFNRVQKIGITGGASTPQWIMDDVAEKIQEISGGR